MPQPLPGRRNKQETRTALVAAAFDELTGQSLDGLSIRRLTAAVGITPAAFYRHFTDLDDIGLVLVDEAVSQLASAVREGLANLNQDNGPAVIATIATSLSEAAARYRPQMIFVARERCSGRERIQVAISDGIRRVTLETAGELKAKTRIRDWSWEDTLVVSDAMVHFGIHFIEQLVLSPPSQRRTDEATSLFYRQLFLLAYGADSIGPFLASGGKIPDSEFESAAALPLTRTDDEESPDLGHNCLSDRRE
ncbi:MAG: TetR family transcriptional regulator [Actinobacteria bacterium]|nr:TetR family transcriptional regulator [Actinomycetota bacterium]MCB9390491.1 TetR family transcriptional regulator [Acidimicrobiia bacterium]